MCLCVCVCEYILHTSIHTVYTHTHTMYIDRFNRLKKLKLNSLNTLHTTNTAIIKACIHTAALKTKELTFRPIPLRLALKKQTPQSHTFKGIKKSRKWNLWSWRLSSLWAFSGFFQHRQLKPSHKEQRESIWVVSEQPAFSCRAQTTCSALWTTHFRRLWTQIHTHVCAWALAWQWSLYLDQ